MNVLLISPLGFAVNAQTRYAGIERLVWVYSKELIEQGHIVSVLGHADSVFPEGVALYPTGGSNKQKATFPFLDAEITSFQTHHHLVRSFDIVHDFSHLHLASRVIHNLPSLNLFWHAPALALFPKASYNIVALSRWAAKEFLTYYHQRAKYQQSIAIDTNTYHPTENPKGERFLTLGRMAPEKGNLEAILLCKEVGVPLDVAGGRGVDVGDAPLTEYESQIIKLCDGEQIKFLGEVTEEEKLNLMQNCKALLYTTDHPEVSNHKIQEVLLCGRPAIAPNLGAQPEIVAHGGNGFLCGTREEYLEAIWSVDSLRPMELYQSVKDTYSVKNVVANYIPLYEKVRDGLRW